MDYADRLDMMDDDCDIEGFQIDNDYLCTDTECYDRGNYHVSCSSCPCYKLNKESN